MAANGADIHYDAQEQVVRICIETEMKEREFQEQFKVTKEYVPEINRVLSENGKLKLEQTMKHVIDLTNKNICEVATMQEGQCFGEQALINNKPRAATIKCKKDC